MFQVNLRNTIAEVGIAIILFAGYMLFLTHDFSYVIFIILGSFGVGIMFATGIFNYNVPNIRQ